MRECLRLQRQRGDMRAKPRRRLRGYEPVQQAAKIGFEDTARIAALGPQELENVFGQRRHVIASRPRIENGPQRLADLRPSSCADVVQHIADMRMAPQDNDQCLHEAAEVEVKMVFVAGWTRGFFRDMPARVLKAVERPCGAPCR